VIWLTALATAAGLLLLVVGILAPAARPGQRNWVEERAAFYSAPGAATLDDELERLSFSERILRPQLTRLSAAIAQRTPDAYLAELERELALAGRPFGLTAEGFVGARLLLAALGATAGVAVGVLLANALLALGLAGFGAATLWAGTGAWLQQSIRARRRAVLRALPDVVDFLVVAVEAGLSFDLALARVVERFKNPLTAGFGQALAEVKLGRYRLEALEDLGRRAGGPELIAFIQMVASSERMGVPIAQVLRIQSQDLRWRRGEAARQRAAQAPVKMTIPMVVLIFPTLWLILLGPSLLQLLRHGL